MSTVPSRSPSPIRSVLQPLARLVPIALVLAVMAGGWWVVQRINEPEEAGESAAAAPSQAADAVPVPNTVSLPQGKMDAGSFQSVEAASRSLQRVETVPGRIRYDESQHIDLRVPMDGMLTELLVVPGQRVKRGELLAVVQSPEIGQARAAVSHRRKQLEIARQLLDRENTLFKNLEELTEMLHRRQPIEAIERTFANRSLGAHRHELLTSYAKTLLASELLEKVKPLADSGSIAGRTIREREANRQVAEAIFDAARDEATFAAQQSQAKAASAVDQAEQQLKLALQSVDTLLGYKQEAPQESVDQESLSRLEVRAPFDATVESRRFASNERVSRGDSLLVLANTQSLYVSASIREGDWSALSLQRGALVKVTVPALDDRSYVATVHYLGREVATDTNAVPLVAKIENQEGLLRPGMFVRVSIPIGEARQALSVKPESVIQHENQQFVFVDMSGGSFRRVDIATGLVSQDWIEVTDGLAPGQPVVTRGAFLLKSELLLQGEDE